MTHPLDHLQKQVLEFWFPDTGHADSMETHGAFWQQRMQGGMDAEIIARFGDLTQAAATCQLDHWAETAYGRLALIIVLDQFPRSLWRDTPAAFAQDIKSCRLAIEGIENGDFDQLKPWEQAFFVICIGHCEGPDHLQRMDWLDAQVEKIIAGMPAAIQPMGDGFRAQQVSVKQVLQQFGRHAHRNPILGRPSSAAEEAYIATGAFPHNSAQAGGAPPES